MKKKALVFLAIILSIIILPFALAANETGVDKAYSCLKSKLGENCGDTLSTEQNVFSLLAMGYDSSIQSDCNDALLEKEGNSCWGKTDADSCNIKSTAQAILALDYIGEDIEEPLTWLMDKKRVSKNLNWYLEIDANEATTCKIKVNDANEKTFTMSDTKKFSGSSSCLTPAVSNYYLRIDNSCLENNFTITCDKKFISTLWYEKPGESTMYVSSETHGADAQGSTIEKVSSYCFGMSSTTCDYQGTLWASLVLAKTGEDTHAYIPYITAMADETENKKYLPSAFLYMLTSEDDYQSELADQQKQDKYWEEASGQRFYDTALALLALQRVNSDKVSNSKDWLLSIQDSSGCWGSGNILETAFILYAAWPKNPVRGAGPLPSSRSYCSDFNFYCVPTGECLLADRASSDGNTFSCIGLNEVCCKTEPTEQTCDEKDGIICESNQRCSESEVTAYDTNYCCRGSCQEVAPSECETAGYFCKTSCSESQEEKTAYSADCNFGESCCGEKSSTGRSWLLIILLIVLIILVILAIVFRNQLKIWFFRGKSKLRFGKGPQPVSRPSPSLASPQFFPQLRPRQIIPRQQQPVRRLPMRRVPPKSSSAKDTAFEDTMKKLRDMSK